MAESNAIFSPCRRYRYRLERIWDSERALCCWILLNPSTADEEKDDPTIRRCCGFTAAWGYGGIIVVNLFAFRSTDPRILGYAVQAVGPENDAAILQAAKDCSLVICGWGAHGVKFGRDLKVVEMLRDSGNVKLKCLGVTSSGQPKHPLRLAAKTTLMEYR